MAAKKDTGAWTRAHIARERSRDAAEVARRERALLGADPFPPGVTPEQLGGEVVACDWDAYEPNIYGGA